MSIIDDDDRAALADAEKGAGFLGDILPLADRDWLDTDPPPRDPLFTRTKGGRESLFMPAGKVSMLVAAGGTGKTTLATQMAVSVSTGTDFLPARGLDALKPAKRGRVLLLFGEEDADEMHRRLYFACRELTREARRLAAQNIYPVPLAGMRPTLMADDENKAPPAFYEIKEALERAGPEPWRLVVLDPASRFMGKDTEKDTAAGTAFIERLEALAYDTPDKPAVLMVHHMSQNASSGGKTTQTASRGTTALTDGARWVANLEKRKEHASDRLAICVVKSNYGPAGAEFQLRRDSRGRLSRMTDEDVKAEDVKAEQEGSGEKKSPTAGDEVEI